MLVHWRPSGIPPVPEGRFPESIEHGGHRTIRYREHAHLRRRSGSITTLAVSNGLADGLVSP